MSSNDFCYLNFGRQLAFPFFLRNRVTAKPETINAAKAMVEESSGTEGEGEDWFEGLGLGDVDCACGRVPVATVCFEKSPEIVVFCPMYVALAVKVPPGTGGKIAAPSLFVVTWIVV